MSPRENGQANICLMFLGPKSTFCFEERSKQHSTSNDGCKPKTCRTTETRERNYEKFGRYGNKNNYRWQKFNFINISNFF